MERSPHPREDRDGRVAVPPPEMLPPPDRARKRPRPVSTTRRSGAA